MSKYITAALEKVARDNEHRGDSVGVQKQTTHLNPKITDQYFNRIPAQKDFSWKTVTVIILLVAAMFGFATYQWMNREAEYRNSSQQELPAKQDSGIAALEHKIQSAVKAAPAEVVFSIQLVSFDDPARAKAEADKLNQTGYSAFVFEEGGQNHVCIDRFTDNASAYKKLKTIRSSLSSNLYKNAFVRVIKKSRLAV